MKLLLFVCMCALAAADQPQVAPTVGQLTVGLTHLYRRFLHAVAPKQLELQDALHIQWRNGMLSGPPFRSPVKGTFDGVEEPTFSYINSLVTPEQKGVFGQWTKHDTSDLLLTYHYGGAMKIHMLTDGGIHKEAILGNPVYHKKVDHKNVDAKFVVMIPKKTYCIFESLSENESTFKSYIAIPAWNKENDHRFTQQQMAAKFPDFTELFNELAKPGVHHAHDNEDHDDHDDHDDHHDEGYHGSYRGRYGGRKYGKH